MVNTARGTGLVAALAVVLALALALGPLRADAATLTSAKFRAGAITTRWALDSGDCAGSLALSGTRAVDDYGFFTGWTVAWGGANCLATSNTRAFGKRDGIYRLQGRKLPSGTYYVQVRYCHDSDFSGNYFCRGSNVRSLRIPRSS
jgi:hypothetical protein